MRVVTRGDFDSLACCVLLTEIHPIREIRFVHPKDAQDGLVDADEDDIVANLPYIKDCGLWFDHHSSEQRSLPDPKSYIGKFDLAPSAARVIHDFYKDEYTTAFAPYTELLAAADRLDAAQLTLAEVTNPEGWILLGLTIDPRSGLGAEFRKYFRWLVEYVKELPIEKVLKHPEVKKRSDRVLKEQNEFNDLLKKHCTVDGKVVVTDFREVGEKPVGNRFLVYALYPDVNVEVRLLKGHKGATVVAVGHSIFERTCNVDVGEMLTEFGGGGHRGAGTAQLPTETAEEGIAEIIRRLQANEG